jgi:hypothetical protein
MVTDPDLAKVRAMCTRLGQLWMPDPASWAWRRPDGMVQGLAHIYADNPGLANLLWLALDMPAPPRQYNVTDNLLAVLVLAQASRSKLNGVPLLDVAALRTLAEFSRLLPEARIAGNELEGAYPVLRLLALRRLRDA